MGQECSLKGNSKCAGVLFACPVFKGKTYCQKHHEQLHSQGGIIGGSMAHGGHGNRGAGITVPAGPHKEEA